MRNPLAPRWFARQRPRAARRRPRLQLAGLEGRDVPAGYTVVETVAVDVDNDGVDSLLVVTREYDSRDHLLQETARFDSDADGTPDAVSHALTQTFDQRGNLTGSVLTQNFNPGVPALTTLTQEYDARGRLTESVQTIDFDGDGTADFADVTTRSYDAQGNLIGQTTLSDSGADGTFESSTVLEQEFDARGNLTGSVETHDFGLDGPDTIVAVAQTFDAGVHLTSSVWTEDWGADGVIDFTSIKTLDYDARGNLIVANTTSGYAESTPQVETLTQAFDARGNLTSSVHTLDFDGDGVADLSTTVNRTYDERGKLISQETTFAGAGGVTLTQEFDARGNLIESIEATDVDADGTADNVITRTFDYPPG